MLKCEIARLACFFYCRTLLVRRKFGQDKDKNKGQGKKNIGKRGNTNTKRCKQCKDNNMSR